MAGRLKEGCHKHVYGLYMAVLAPAGGPAGCIAGLMGQGMRVHGRYGIGAGSSAHGCNAMAADSYSL